MNYTILSGNLVRDPEIVDTGQSEYGLIKFSIANNDERRKNRDTGEYEDVVSYFDLQYWTKNVSLWSQRLWKGCGVVCECRAKQDRWQQEDGTNRSRVIFTVRKFPIMQASKEQPSVPSSSQDAPEQKPTYTPPSAPAGGGYEDDIPF